MSPSVPFAGPGEKPVSLQPYQVVMHIQEGFVCFRKDVLKSHGLQVPDPHLVGILKPVQLLNDHLLRIWNHLHPDQVVISRIARNIKPLSCASCSCNHS